MRISFVAVLVALACVQAHAQRTATLKGLGNYGCGKYLEHRKTDNEDQDNAYVSWVWGYLSGYNQFSSHKEVQVPDHPTILAYLDKYCRDNPLKLVVAGTLTLIGELDGWKPSARKP